MHSFPAVLVLLLLIALIGTTPANRTGDGAEYAVMAHGILDGHVAFDAADRADAEAWRRGVGLGFGDGVLEMPPLQDANGVQDFPHFWMYPLLAAPGVALAELVNVSPTWGFVGLNLLLLLMAIRVAAPILGPWGSLFFFGNPVIWWVNKIHTESFTFSLLTIAFAMAFRSPGWAFVALGLASTQNPPVALVMPAFAIAGILARPRIYRSFQWWLGGAAGAALAVIHPLYYRFRLGVNTPQELNGGVSDSWWYGIEKTLAPLIDLNIGLFVAFPGLVALTLVFLGSILVHGARRVRKGGTADWRGHAPHLVLAGVVIVVFLLAFAKTTNVNSGGTPNMTRYGIWLIPCALPVIAWMRRVKSWEVAVPSLAIISSIVTIATYHPSKPENYQQPTRLAAWTWSRLPHLYSPYWEIFSERIRHREDPPELLAGAATPDCGRVLIVLGRAPNECTLGVIPEGCLSEVATCYAVRSSRSAAYEFDRIRGPADAEEPPRL